MRGSKSKKASLKRLGRITRKTVTMAKADLIQAKPLFPNKSLPLLVQPASGVLNLVDWAKSNTEFIEKNLSQHGAILFRNFVVDGLTGFEQFIRTVSGQLLEYKERSSPRSQVKGNVYTSTDYPADQSIFLHNENSYQSTFPLKIFFFCVTPPKRGGETPIADCRQVLQRLDPIVRERFVDKQCLYVRNFGNDMGLSWQTVYQTTNKADVEAHCRRAGTKFEWLDGDRLRTYSVRPAIEKHPKSGEMIWFNHATFFHISTLPQTIREALLAEFDEADLPANTYYGDGLPIEPEVLEQLRDAYHQETVMFPWQKGDVLMLDNMIAAHARQPFEGPRKIVVGMSEPYSRENKYPFMT